MNQLEQAFYRGFQKRAEQEQGFTGHNLQAYMPVQARRELTEREREIIKREAKKILPKIFDSNKDLIARDMSSPTWAGIGGGAAGGALGGLGGLALSAGDPLFAFLGGLGGAGLGGLISYKNREARNEDLEDAMTRLPEMATRRDRKADPVYQKEMDRRATTNNSNLLPALILANAMR